MYAQNPPNSPSSTPASDHISTDLSEVAVEADKDAKPSKRALAELVPSGTLVEVVNTQLNRVVETWKFTKNPIWGGISASWSNKRGSLEASDLIDPQLVGEQTVLPYDSGGSLIDTLYKAALDGEVKSPDDRFVYKVKHEKNPFA